ncbi:Ribokinase-like protein [Clavulina sp. PMI_390]|nr:Ribokinase-like protein [Clavulina sp. PMI_390]
MSTQTYPLFCLGNPLLDIQVRDGEKLLEKYDLKANDAILAEDKHMKIYDDVLEDYNKPVFVAGGAAQNAARAAAYVLPPKSVVYTGCVGDDPLAEQLKAANSKESVESAYMVKKGEKTGACAVVITDVHRSLVTTLRAAEMFTPAHLQTPEMQALIDGATHFYIGGFFLTHGLESAKALAKQASDAGKLVAMNLSAPFLVQFFKAQVDEMLPFVDVVIGNESEAGAFAAATGLPSEDLGAIAVQIASLTKINPSRPRTVIITNGSESTFVATSGAGAAKKFPVTKLPASEIVDTNGAGDCFAGGFMGALMLGKSVDEAVEVGHKLGAMCVGQVGPMLKWPKETVV